MKISKAKEKQFIELRNYFQISHQQFVRKIQCELTSDDRKLFSEWLLNQTAKAIINDKVKPAT